MAFVDSDITAALGAGFPHQTFELDGTLDLDDASHLFGVGAVMNGVGGGGGGGYTEFDLILARRTVRR